MKIVQLSTASTGGAGTAAYRLHSGLARQKDVYSSFVQQGNILKSEDNHIYSIPPDNSLLSRIKRKLKLSPEYLNAAKVATYSSRQYEIATFPTTSYRIERSEIIKNADIINLHWIANFLNYPTFFNKVRQPVVWTLHDMNPFQGIFHYEGDMIANQNNLGEIDRQICAQKLRYIHQFKNLHIVCLCDWMKKKSENSDILGRYPHYVIPNGLNLSQYPLLDKGKAIESLGINNGLKTILFISVGLEIRRKGFDLLLKAIETLRGNSNFNLITVGGEKINIEKKVNHIHYNRIENNDELNIIYSAADITIIPSREDNLPNVMLESFANGTPVMSFSNGGMAEHIKTGENGVLLNEIGVEPLSTGINDFLNNKYNFDRGFIRKYAEDVFSDKLQAERYIELYKNILSK